MEMFTCISIFIIIVVLYFAITTFRKRKSAVVYSSNTVILYQFERGSWTPSPSPFCLKLETYLRMANIPYQNEYGYKPSSKGKMPWIRYNEDVVDDSQLCIEYLNKKLDVDLDVDLDPKDKAIGRAFLKMTEENLYWCLLLWRWVYSSVATIQAYYPQMPKLLIYWIRHDSKKRSEGHGIGRHTEQEVMKIAKGDIRAISDFLGQKEFMFGDEPTLIDCSIFGSMACIVWGASGSSLSNIIKDEMPNLVPYCERMKVRYWPDWDDCITHGWTTTPTK